MEKSANNVHDGARLFEELYVRVELACNLITFRVRHSRGEMCIGHGRLCVCLPVPCRILTLLHGPACKLRNGRGCPVVVYCWANMQSWVLLL